MMKHMIDGEYGDGVFESFVEAVSSLPQPELVNSKDSYTCTKIFVQDVGFSKRMFWCKPRLYRKKSGNYDEIDGFFCAGSQCVRCTIFAFRPPRTHSVSVRPVGEMHDPDLFRKQTPIV